MASYVLELLGGDSFLTRLLFGWFLDTSHLFKVLHSSDMVDLGRMRVIQDCYIPHSHTIHFIQQIDTIGIYPLWLCPVKSSLKNQYLACHYGKENFINVGIYGRPRDFPFNPESIHHRLIELLIETGGRSMLYAQTWHTNEQFTRIYGDALERVEEVKEKYGGTGVFYDLYEKVALKAWEREKLRIPVEGTEQQAQVKVVKDILMQKLGMK
jgi:delta24-sterol reductase